MLTWTKIVSCVAIWVLFSLWVLANWHHWEHAELAVSVFNLQDVQTSDWITVILTKKSKHDSWNMITWFSDQLWTKWQLFIMMRKRICGHLPRDFPGNIICMCVISANMHVNTWHSYEGERENFWYNTKYLLLRGLAPWLAWLLLNSYFTKKNISM